MENPQRQRRPRGPAAILHRMEPRHAPSFSRRARWLQSGAFFALYARTPGVESHLQQGRTRCSGRTGRKTASVCEHRGPERPSHGSQLVILREDFSLTLPSTPSADIASPHCSWCSFAAETKSQDKKTIKVAEGFPSIVPDRAARFAASTISCGTNIFRAAL